MPVARHAWARYRRHRYEGRIQRFLDERCLVSSSISVGATSMFKAYAAWCDESGESAVKQTAFGRRLNDLGFHTERGIGGRVVRHGIGLLDTSNHEGFE